MENTENLLKKMKVAGRLEPATFRSEGEHVNHCATVTFANLHEQLSILPNGSMLH